MLLNRKARRAAKALLKARRAAAAKDVETKYKVKLATLRVEYDEAVAREPESKRDHFIHYKAEREKTRAARDYLLAVINGKAAKE